MYKLDWKETIQVAHIMADLKPSARRQEVPELTELLGVDKVEYVRTPDDGELDGIFPTIYLQNRGDEETWSSGFFLHQCGAWKEVWARLIVSHLDNSSVQWLRDDDLSAMLGYSMRDCDCGVFYHQYEEGTVEFKVVTSNYYQSYFEAMDFLKYHL